MSDQERNPLRRGTFEAATVVAKIRMCDV